MSAPEQLREELTARIRAAQAEWRAPSVSAAVMRAGEVVWADAAGLAEIESGEEATPEHQYRVGSITKTFTAVAIMQLRDEGKLDLDDPLDRFVERAHHAPTIGRLLSHTSGLQREPPGDVWETMEFVSAEELVATLADAEQVLAPGARWHYSNLAFALLGEVVGRLAGIPYERWVQERILEPLGLRRTTFAPVEPHASGYFVEPYFDDVRPEDAVETGGTTAAGQLWSTTADLCRWCAFFAEPDEEVLRAETVEEMQALRAIADHERWSYGHGLGVQLFRDEERVFTGHGGAMPGFLAQFVVSRKEKVGAVVFANSSAGAKVQTLALELAGKAADALPREVEPWRPADPPPAELEGALGRWWSEGREFVVVWRNSRLELDYAEPPREAIPATVFERLDHDRYRATTGPEQGELLRIVRDDDGNVTRLYFATYPFTRQPEVFGTKAVKVPGERG